MIHPRVWNCLDGVLVQCLKHQLDSDYSDLDFLSIPASARPGFLCFGAAPRRTAGVTLCGQAPHPLPHQPLIAERPCVNRKVHGVRSSLYRKLEQMRGAAVRRRPTHVMRRLALCLWSMTKVYPQGLYIMLKVPRCVVEHLIDELGFEVFRVFVMELHDLPGLLSQAIE